MSWRDDFAKLIILLPVAGCSSAGTDGLLMTSSACFGRLISWLTTWGSGAEDRRTHQGESRRVCLADPFLHTRLGIISWWEDFHNSASVLNRCVAWWCADCLHCVCGFPLQMNIGMTVISVWEKRNNALHFPTSHLVLPVATYALKKKSKVDKTQKLEATNYRNSWRNMLKLLYQFKNLS